MKRFSYWLAAACLATPFVFANAQGPNSAPGSGPHGGMMHGKGNHMCCGSKDTHGWSLMSGDERQNHRDKMLSMKSHDECKAYHDEHRKTMEDRAKSQGKTLMKPRVDMCERMKSRGQFK
jgi:hypothetical protein